MGVNINLANNCTNEKWSKVPPIVVVNKIEKKSLTKNEEEEKLTGKLIGIKIHRKMTLHEDRKNPYRKKESREFNLTGRRNRRPYWKLA